MLSARTYPHGRKTIARHCDELAHTAGCWDGKSVGRKRVKRCAPRWLIAKESVGDRVAGREGSGWMLTRGGEGWRWRCEWWPVLASVGRKLQRGAAKGETKECRHAGGPKGCKRRRWVGRGESAAQWQGSCSAAQRSAPKCDLSVECRRELLAARISPVSLLLLLLPALCWPASALACLARSLLLHRSPSDARHILVLLAQPRPLEASPLEASPQGGVPPPRLQQCMLLKAMLPLRQMQPTQQRPHVAFTPLHEAMHRCRGVCRTLGRLAISPIHPPPSQKQKQHRSPPRLSISGSNPPDRSNTLTSGPKFQSHTLKLSASCAPASLLSRCSAFQAIDLNECQCGIGALLPTTAATTSSCAGARHAASCAASCTCACGSSSCASCARCPS